MCQLAGVSRASFYRCWEQGAPPEAEVGLREAIQQAAIKHRCYGYRRIQVLIEREGFQVGAKKVRRLMREDNLLAVRRRKFIVTTDSDHPFQVYPNLAEHLVLSNVNQLWVADLTYVRLQSEFVYLAVVLDAWSRRVVGWALGRSLESALPLLALGRAVASRQPQPGLVHHSDPWENGKCESFMATLKREQIDARPYTSLEELERDIQEFIDQTYNRVRLHSALTYLSPEQFEARQAQAKTTPPWLPAVLSLSRHEEVSPGPAPLSGGQP
jgi:putative transposase